jgi:hypothetical protein
MGVWISKNIVKRLEIKSSDPYTVYIDINSITVGGIKIERMEGSNVAR